MPRDVHLSRAKEQGLAQRTFRSAASLLAAGALVSAGALLCGCTSATHPIDRLPTWTYSPAMNFPADGSLARAEDGVALPDGRLIVSDQVHGLRAVAPDGSSRPFGEMAAAGYAHDPPGHSAAANGVSLDPGGRHLLVADVLGGGIYRVAVADGATERVFQHRFGVNTAVRDRTGAVWFTQSTETTAEQGEGRMFAAVDMPAADGSLWRLPFRDGRFAAEAELVRGDLKFPNGLVLDERRGAIYVAETLRDRVLRAPLDVAAGRVGEMTTLLEIATPDNLELDDAGRLWVASPVCNQVVVVDPVTGRSRSVFRVQTPAQSAAADEFVRRGKAGAPRLELLTPQIWAPLPGLVTGIIPPRGDGDGYVTGLGNALVRLRR